MGDFAGGLLKYVRRHPVPRLTIGGGFAKISKLADGHLDLHSARSQVDPERLAERAAGRGSGCRAAGPRSVPRTRPARRSPSPRAPGSPSPGPWPRRRASTALEVVRGAVEIEVVIVDRAGGVCVRSHG